MASKAGLEAQETLHALLIELVPEVADKLVERLVVDEEIVERPEMTMGALRELLHTNYRWALETDISTPESRRFVWYKSVNAGELRPWLRMKSNGRTTSGSDLPRSAERSMRGAFGRRPQSSARLLLARPGLPASVAWVQLLNGLNYHSPIMNTMDEALSQLKIWMINVALHGIDKTSRHPVAICAALITGQPMKSASGKSGDLVLACSQPTGTKSMMPGLHG